MKTIHYDVKTPLGLRMHTLVELSEIAAKYKSTIIGFTNDFKADIKSILNVVALEAMPGDVLTILIEGEDEEEARNSIEAFLENIK